MPAIYRHLEGEVHIYINRKPRPNGGEPGFILPATLWFFTVLWLLMLAVQIMLTEIQWTTIMTMYVIFATTFALRKYNTRMVFRHDTREIHRRSFLSNKCVGSYSDVADIRLCERPMGPKGVYCAIIWQDSMRAPEPLSPVVKNNNYLARYYYDIIPLLRTVLDISEETTEDEPAAVEVDSVELSFQEAQALLGTGEGARADAPRDLEALLRSDLHCFVYKEKTGLYYSRITRRQVIVAVVISLFCFALGVAVAMPVLWIRLGAGACLLIFLVGIFPESVSVRLDPATREIHNYTRFFLKRTVYPLDHLVGVQIMEFPGLSAIVLNMRDPKANCSAFEGSNEEIRTAIGELGRILGIDAERLLRQ